MSTWLSAANKASGQGHSIWTAELMRQHKLMTKELTRQSIRFWASAWKLPRIGKLEK